MTIELPLAFSPDGVLASRRALKRALSLLACVASMMADTDEGRADAAASELAAAAEQGGGTVLQQPPHELEEGIDAAERLRAHGHEHGVVAAEEPHAPTGAAVRPGVRSREDRAALSCDHGGHQAITSALPHASLLQPALLCGKPSEDMVREFKQRFNDITAALRGSLETERKLLERVAELSEALNTRTRALEVAYAHSLEDGKRIRALQVELVAAEEARDLAQLMERDALRDARRLEEENRALRRQLAEAETQTSQLSHELAEAQVCAGHAAASQGPIYNLAAAKMQPTPFERWKADNGFVFQDDVLPPRRALTSRHVHALGHVAHGDLVILVPPRCAEEGSGTADSGRLGGSETLRGRAGTWSRLHSVSSPCAAPDQTTRGARSIASVGSTSSAGASPGITARIGQDWHAPSPPVGLDKRVISEEMERLRSTLARLAEREEKIASLRAGGAAASAQQPVNAARGLVARDGSV